MNPELHPDIYLSYLRSQEYGVRKHRMMGFSDKLHAKLYRNLLNSKSEFSHNLSSNHANAVGPTGGIFNLEYNEDGSLLAAACQKQNILLFDPISRKLINNIENAHYDSVNCIRFLDSRTFASCSDDTTVAVWDARNLKTRIRTLRGHSNSVKNIEYSFRENLLVTSGFDGAIFTWDINKRFGEGGVDFTKVFYVNGLMRMRLTPDASKMVVSTMNGYILVIHDLSLGHLKQDLRGFKPNMYRLMQVAERELPLVVGNTHLFYTGRNRVQILSDFAPNNDAEMISSLQIHPNGWVVASRNTDADDKSEWCCVHDIHAYPPSEEDPSLNIDDISNATLSPNSISANSESFSNSANVTPSSGVFARLSEFMGPSITPPFLWPSSMPNSSRDEDEVSLTAQQETNDVRNSGPPRSNGVDFGSFRILTGSSEASLWRGRLRSRPTSVDENSDNRIFRRLRRANEFNVSRQMPIYLVQDGNRSQETPTTNNAAINQNNSDLQLHHVLVDNSGGSIIFIPSPRTLLNFEVDEPHSTERSVPPAGRRSSKIHYNRRRMTHYIEETNTGKGFIKEISFSPDGRIFCSPFGFGVRLLGFHDNCTQLSQLMPPVVTAGDNFPAASKLSEIGYKLATHCDVVLASAFSPHNFSLVSGCLGGKIVWHEPVF